MAKFRIYHKEEAPEAANCALWVLKTVLAQGLKLLHPFMPFITEEIYGVARSGGRVAYDVRSG